MMPSGVLHDAGQALVEGQGLPSIRVPCARSLFYSWSAVILGIFLVLQPVASHASKKRDGWHQTTGGMLFIYGSSSYRDNGV